MDRVVLRRFRDKPREVIALLVDEPEGAGRCSSYMHIGQHSVADLALTRDTDPVAADDGEGLALLAELRSIGYTPKVLRRVPRWSSLPRR